MINKPFSRLLLAVIVLLLSACASFSDGFRKVEQQMARGDLAKALETLEAHPGPDRDRVLFLLNRGMLQRLNLQYEASNASLEEAKQRMVELRAASISESVGSVTVNEGLRSYVGDPYEQVLLHLVMALNYLQLGELDSARVEVLQVDQRLRQVNQDVNKAYQEDAFARLLSGMIFEELREYSDAMIAYRKAYETYQKQQASFHVELPSSLKYDLLRLSERMGLKNENRRYQKAFAISRWPSVAERRKQGQVAFILANGLAPIKGEQAIHVQDYYNNRLHRLAVPYYRSRPYLIGGARLRIDDLSQESERVENIDAIARTTLEEQMPGITARAMARVVAKNKMVKEAQDASPLAGFVTNVATLATERADTRSWVTLPSEYQMARLWLSPGRYRLEIQLLGRSGGVVDAFSIEEVVVEAGKTTYLTHRWLSASTARR